MTTFPSDEKTLFLICDSARPEQGGKTTLIGYFGSEEIWFPSPQQFPLAFPVSFVFVFRDGDGTFPATISISQPNNTTVTQPAPDVVKEPLKTCTAVVQVPMFIVPSFGDYRITMSLAGRNYSRIFRIRAQP